MKTRHKQDSFATPQDLSAHVSYDKETGVFIHVMKKRGTKQGTEAGTIDKDGYRLITINKQIYRAHRLAWFLSNGSWPVGVIDHINGNRLDNRIGNLRDVHPSVNQENRRTPQKNNTSGFLGVRPHRNKWQALVSTGGKSIVIGTFTSRELAHEAYLVKKRQLHKGCTL
jgi:hypothetical protein